MLTYPVRFIPSESPIIDAPISSWMRYCQPMNGGVLQVIRNDDCIFTIIVPLVSEANTEATLQPSELPEREVTAQLVRNLLQIHQLQVSNANNVSILPTFRKTLKLDDVDVDAITALEVLDDLNQGKGLNICIQWSALLSLKPDTPKRIEISSDAIKLLKSGFVK